MFMIHQLKKMIMINEIFKDIPNYEGQYRISNLGNINSLQRQVWMQINNCYKTLKEKPLKQRLDGRGYLSTCLYKNSIPKTHKVHQLVAMAFLSHKPNGCFLHIDHIDGNKLNNNVNNLQILTAREHSTKTYSTKKSSSKHIGVSWHNKSKKWRALIHINGKSKYLGIFKNEFDAHLKYQKELKIINNLKKQDGNKNK